MSLNTDIDTKVYFEIAAEGLIRNLGSQAFDVADEAVSRLRMVGDDESLEMWLGVQAALHASGTAFPSTQGKSIH